MEKEGISMSEEKKKMTKEEFLNLEGDKISEEAKKVIMELDKEPSHELPEEELDKVAGGGSGRSVISCPRCKIDRNAISITVYTDLYRLAWHMIMKHPEQTVDEFCKEMEGFKAKYPDQFGDYSWRENECIYYKKLLTNGL